MIILGIDPGKLGGMAVLDSELNTLLDVTHTPRLPTGDIDSEAMLEWITGWCPRDHTRVGLERVSAIRGAGANSTFQFGVSYGIAKGIVQGLGLPLHEIPPVKWKRGLGLRVGANKDDSRALAMSLFPGWKGSFARKKDDGPAEAALIAEFARIEFGL